MLITLKSTFTPAKLVSVTRDSKTSQKQDLKTYHRKVKAHNSISFNDDLGKLEDVIKLKI
jgi:hypothetical protein